MHLVFLAFVSECDAKREGHPFKVKGIADQLCSNVLQFLIKIYSFEISTRAPGSSLVLK